MKFITKVRKNKRNGQINISIPKRQLGILNRKKLADGKPVQVKVRFKWL